MFETTLKMYNLCELKVSKEKYDHILDHYNGKLLKDGLEESGKYIKIRDDLLEDKMECFEASDYKEAIDRVGSLADEGILSSKEAISIINLIYIIEMESCAVKQYGTLLILNSSGDFSLMKPNNIWFTIQICKERIRL